MYAVHYPHTMQAVVVVLWIILQTGSGMAAAPVYRCIDEAGRVVFSQFLCPRGAGDTLRITVPKIGWQMVAPRPSVAHTQTAPAVLSSPSGMDRKPVRKRKDACWKAQRKLQQIARHLRKGYRRDVGEHLRRQREDKEAYVSRFCSALSSSSR